MGLIGAAMPDLRAKIGLTDEEVSWVLTGRTAGFLTGSVLGELPNA